MDGIAGIIVFFVIISLLDKAAKASKKARGAQNGNASQQPPQRMPAAKEQTTAKVAAAKPAARPVSTEGTGTPQIQRTVRTPAKFAAAETGDALDLTMLAAKQLRKKLNQPKEKTSIEKDVEARNLAADKEGCIGGSIAHTQHEGESKAEHTEHMLRVIRPAAAQTAQPAVSIQQLRTADLRKAVVMSEILDKPVSMRGRKVS